MADAPAEPESMNRARGFEAIAFCAAESARLALDWLSRTVRSSFFPLMPPLALMLFTATSTPAAPGAETLAKSPVRSEIRVTLYVPPLTAELLELAPPPPLPHAAR